MIETKRKIFACALLVGAESFWDIFKIKIEFIHCSLIIRALVVRRSIASEIAFDFLNYSWDSYLNASGLSRYNQKRKMAVIDSKTLTKYLAEPLILSK